MSLLLSINNSKQAREEFKNATEWKTTWSKMQAEEKVEDGQQAIMDLEDIWNFIDFMGLLR